MKPIKNSKQILIIIVILGLLTPSFPSAAKNSSDGQESIQANSRGEFTSKDEVVYGLLAANGAVENMYVVNSLDVIKSGPILDYGKYTDLKNLTDLSELLVDNETVEITAPEGKFFYQGNLTGLDLPWDLSIEYYLDGKKLSAAELAGKSGQVMLKIKSIINERVDEVFSENYLLQISVPLNNQVFTNIVAKDAVIANVGKDKQVNFTVMPGKNGDFIITADAADFKLDGIDISAIPSIMAIDDPDIDEMKDEMASLSDAIQELNTGVGKLKDGSADLAKGSKDLEKGSWEIQTGLKEINGSTIDLLEASTQINKALEMMQANLPEDIGLDDEELMEVAQALAAIADGLDEVASALGELIAGYEEAYGALGGAIGEIPNQELSEDKIKSLYNSDVDREVVNQLVRTYEAAMKVKATYENVKPAFDAVKPTINSTIEGLKSMSAALRQVSSEFTGAISEITDGLGQLDELFTGIKELSKEYQLFHQGFTKYGDGINKITKSYGELDDGIGGLSKGTADLDQGVADFQTGTSELHKETEKLPDEMQREIDAMMAEYDKGDFEAKSFVSNKNSKIDTVQFVLKTAAIKAPKEEETVETRTDKKGIWQRFLDLFR